MSRRPFDSVKEMDETIINNWNNIVSPNDTVYHLGDFGDINIVQYLNGKIKILPGNYEIDDNINLEDIGIPICVNSIIDINDIQMELVHRPLDAKSNNFVLFGHIHKLCMVKRNGLNVGIDCHYFTPITEEIVMFYYNAVLNHYDENVFVYKL